MKKLIFLAFITFILSCNNSEKKISTSNSESLIKENIDTTSIHSARIDILDYSELEPYLNRNNDSTYVVNFWATWCKPCIKEMPYFEKLDFLYAEKKVKVIFVSLDFPEKIERQVIPFLTKNNIRSKVVLLDDPDANSWIPKVSKQWSGAIPATIIYNNKDRRFYERSFTYDELEKEIISIL